MMKFKVVLIGLTGLILAACGGSSQEQASVGINDFNTGSEDRQAEETQTKNSEIDQTNSLTLGVFKKVDAEGDDDEEQPKNDDAERSSKTEPKTPTVNNPPFVNNPPVVRSPPVVNNTPVVNNPPVGVKITQFDGGNCCMMAYFTVSATCSAPVTLVASWRMLDESISVKRNEITKSFQCTDNSLIWKGYIEEAAITNAPVALDIWENKSGTLVHLASK